jgi:hypothetical protein
MITNNRLEDKFRGRGDTYSFGGMSSAYPPRGLPPYCGHEFCTWPNGLLSYAGGSIRSVQGHPCQTWQRERAGRSVGPGPPGWGLGIGAYNLNQKKFTVTKIRRGQAPVKRKKISELHGKSEGKLRKTYASVGIFCWVVLPINVSVT